MKLGAFSVSLSVKDLETSKQFYENLGFSVFAGGKEHNYLIMKNEDTVFYSWLRRAGDGACCRRN